VRESSQGEAVRMSADLIRWTGGPGSGENIPTPGDGPGRGGGRPDPRRHDVLMTFSRSQAADLADRLARVGLPRRGPERHPPAVRDGGRDRPSCGPCGRPDLRLPRSDPHRTNGRRVRRRRSRCTGSLCRRTGSRIPRNAYAPEDGDPVARAKLPAGNQILEINAYLSATMQPRRPGSMQRQP